MNCANSINIIFLPKKRNIERREKKWISFFFVYIYSLFHVIKFIMFFAKVPLRDAIINLWNKFPSVKRQTNFWYSWIQRSLQNGCSISTQFPISRMFFLFSIFQSRKNVHIIKKYKLTMLLHWATRKIEGNFKRRTTYNKTRFTTD